jgi:hypothetical protein
MITVDVDLKEMGQIIEDIKQKVQRLREISGGMQCVERNCVRMLASIKMLEINISDVLEFLE